LSKIENISGIMPVFLTGNYHPVPDSLAVPPVRHGFLIQFSPEPDYIEADPKQSLSLITSLTNAPQYPLTDTGGLAELNSQESGKRQIRNFIKANRTLERIE
jgi:hypothetical protein